MTTDLSLAHKAFESDQRTNSENAYNSLATYEKEFLESYSSISPLQAWNAYILSGSTHPEVFKIYVEAQNDALISHLLARQGLWRPSLQSLRSCLENILVFHYYIDHPVEFEMWGQGKHKIGFSELLNYYQHHPKFNDKLLDDLTGLPGLKSEYAKLSMAVHGSSASFMMGRPEIIPNVYIADRKNVGQWKSRLLSTMQSINLFMLTYHRGSLLGTAYPAMRKALVGSFSNKQISEIKKLYSVILH